MMRRMQAIIVFFIAVLLSSCAPSYEVSSWKALNTLPRTYSKIMVVGIIRSADTSLRRQMEARFVNDLKALGYNAVSALEEYGPKGLSNLTQEITYIKLCDNGIDGIVTVALLDKTKEGRNAPVGARYNSSSFYYNHILNYRRIAADLTDSSHYKEDEKRFRLESILFDLRSLQPLYVAQTKNFTATSFNGIQKEYGRIVLRDMVRKKVLSKQPKSVIKPLRPF